MNPIMKGPSLQLTACFVVERTRGVSKLDLRSNLTQSGLMDYLLELLIQLVAIVWRADSEIRDRSLLGESEMEKRARRTIARCCVGLIALLVIAWLVWWWLT
jgi:hypothetical protein